jgi:hypothetical protein
VSRAWLAAFLASVLLGAQYSQVDAAAEGERPDDQTSEESGGDQQVA